MVYAKKRGPMYLQVKEEIKERILSNMYPVGENIPTESDLVEEFGVSKITVRRALTELAQEGFLLKQSGRGTRVISNKAFSKLSTGQNFTEFLKSEGFLVDKTLLSVELVQLQESDRLFRYFGRECYLAKRRFELDGKPYIFFQHYLPTWIDFSAECWEDNNSIYLFMAEKGVNFQHFLDEFEVELDAAEACAILGIGEKPLLKRIRTSFDEAERCVEYAEAFYDTGVHRYVVKLEV